MEERMTLDECFAMLGRDPDVDAPELFAYDAADHLLLETAAPHLGGLAPGELVVIGDRHGALTLGAAQVSGQRGIRTYQDPVLGERALARNAERLGFTAATAREVYTSHSLDSALLAGARVVLLQLPRALDALDEIAAWIAAEAAPDVVVFAGGRDKHMSRSMNDILARYFGEVSAGRGVRKARVLTATQPRADAAGVAFPRWGRDPELSFELASFGATFGGPTFDHGSRLLLAGLRAEHTGSASLRSTPRRIVDLGCGNGVLAVSAALLYPEAEIIATDQSHAAVAATKLTAARAGADIADRMTVHRADGMEAVPDGWADLVLLNPPFHTGATVHAEVAHRLIKACARALAPGGELRIVFNSHMRYRPLVERRIGATRQVARDKTFTVLSSIRAQ